MTDNEIIMLMLELQKSVIKGNRYSYDELEKFYKDYKEKMK